MTTLRTSAILLLTTLLGISCSEKRIMRESNTFIFPEIVDITQSASYYFSPTSLSTPINFIETIEKVGNKANLRDRKIENKNFIDDLNFSDTTNKSVVARTGLSLFVQLKHGNLAGVEIVMEASHCHLTIT